MKTLLATLVLALAAMGAAAQCLDYDTVMPLISELPDVGDVIDVDSRDHWLYVLEEINPSVHWLQIYDASDPAAPQLATQIGIPGRSHRILARDGRLYILTRPADTTSLYIYTNEPPAFPTLLGSLVIDDDVLDLDVEGTTVALAAATGGLIMVDAADPAAMAVIGGFTPPAGQGDGRAVDLRGDRALLGLGTVFPDAGHLHWLDVSNPAAPVPLGEAAAGREVIEAHLLADQPQALLTSDDAMALLDLTNPAAPVVGPWRIAAGEHLVVLNDLALQINQSTGASMLVDLSVPAAPRWLAPRPRTILDAAPVPGGVALARGDDGLAIAELTGPAAAPIEGVADNDVGAGVLVPAGLPSIVLGLRRIDTAIDVQVLDVSDPAAPRVRSTISQSSPRAVACQGSLALVAGSSTGQLVDLSDPDLPQLLATWTPPSGTIDMLWHGNVLYVSANSGGLVVMDVTDPALPVELSRFDPPSSVRSVAAYGESTLLVANSGDGVKVMDVSDPAAPTLISEVDIGGIAANLMVDGTRCFVGGFFDSDLVEIDLSDPAAPTVAGITSLVGGSGNMAVNGGQLWVEGASAINVLDIGPPGSLVPAGRLDFFSYVGGLVPAGEYMVASCGYVVVLKPPCSTITSVDEPAPLAPVAWLRVAPNPANPRSVIAFQITTPGQGRLDIYDLAGRRVRTPWQGHLEAGRHAFTWDGRDASGRALASGTYLARLVAGGATRTAKVSLVR